MRTGPSGTRSVAQRHLAHLIGVVDHKGIPVDEQAIVARLVGMHVDHKQFVAMIAVFSLVRSYQHEHDHDRPHHRCRASLDDGVDSFSHSWGLVSGYGFYAGVYMDGQ